MTAEAIAAWQARWGEGPHVTADVVVFTLLPDRRLAVLLVERGVPPFVGEYALPGGFVQLDEDVEDAARRELGEETGVTERVAVEQLATFGAPERDPRGRTVTVAYLALVPYDQVKHAKGGDDARAARFFSVEGDRPVDDRGRRLRLAFDHEEIVRIAVERLRGKVTYTTAPFALMPEEFTLSELQAAYEAILGRELHRRAFRQRMEGEHWVIETGNTRGGAHRPARTFRAATRELLWMRPWPEAAKITGGMKTRAPGRRKKGS
jgi:8-oxo-dGTP diphosphatase